MPIDFEIDGEGIVRTRLRGSVTTEEYLSHPGSVASDPELVLPLRELFDTTAVESTEVDYASVEVVTNPKGATPPTLRGGRIAVLVESDLTFGLGRMFQAMARTMDFEVLVTRNRDEAERFLADHRDD